MYVSDVTTMIPVSNNEVSSVGAWRPQILCTMDRRPSARRDDASVLVFGSV